MGITASNLSFGEVNRRFYGRKLRFTAPLTRRRKTKFPTVKKPIYLPKWQIWMQLSPKDTVANFWRYPIRRRVTYASALEYFVNERLEQLFWIYEMISKTGSGHSKITHYKVLKRTEKWEGICFCVEQY